MHLTTAIIVYPRVGNNASRILKEADFLINNGIVEQVLILSMFYDPKLGRELKITESIRILRLKTYSYNLPKNAIGDSIKFTEFIVRCILLINKIRPKFVIPHSLSVLPIGVWAKIINKRPLIYNAHELETERYKLKGIRKLISKTMERTLIKYCDKVIVVNEHIANWYRNIYKLENVYSIPNIPNNPYVGELFPRTSLLRKDFQIPEDTIIFIYQGILSKGRGIIEMLELFSSDDLPRDRVIVFMGFGEMEEKIKTAASDSSQIFFKSSVPPSEVLSYTSSADVGIFFILEPDMCLSYKLSLPNKFFEYTLAGLYLCVNDRFKVMDKLINDNKLGVVLTSDITHIKKFIISVTKEMIKNEFALSVDYRRNLDWKENANKLKNIFLALQ